MAFKFPFTNYHELNLTWVLDQLKSLFEKSEENVTVIENYNGRLTAVETELPLVAETAQDASQTAANAASLAQTAKTTADTAQENAIQAQGLAGTARQEAQAARTAADAATQAAQQAQATAQNFDGRITQAENDASQALEASRSFENRVQSAITTANNAAQTATNAQGIATRADQNAALALNTLKAQRSELERIGAEQVERITEETENGKTEIENLAQSVLDSIPSDYTALSNLVDKKAPVIINSASGSVASFNDGADNMKIQKLVVNIEPVQAGSGDPSPDNVRPISGWTGAEVTRTGKNLLNLIESEMISSGWNRTFPISVKEGTYILSCQNNFGAGTTFGARVAFIGDSDTIIKGLTNGYNFGANNERVGTAATITSEEAKRIKRIKFELRATGASYSDISRGNLQLELGSTATAFAPYTGNQISVTFPSEAGTVYGGTLTLNPDRTGTLVVTEFGYTFNGTENMISPVRNDLAMISFPNESFALWANPSTKRMSSHFRNASTYGWDNVENNQWLAAGGNYFGFGGYTIAEFKEYAAEQFSNGTPITCYTSLASPVSIPLTAEQVSGILETLYGTNNIWADAGPVSVEYPADTKLYIDGKLAELQATILENI